MLETVERPGDDDWVRSTLTDYNFHALVSAKKLGELAPTLACSVFGLTPPDVEYLSQQPDDALRPLASVNILLFLPYCTDSRQRGITFFEYCLQFDSRAPESYFPANFTPLIGATDNVIHSVTRHLWFLVTMLAVRAPEKCALLLRVPISQIEHLQNLSYADIEYQLQRRSVMFTPTVPMSAGDLRSQYQHILRMMTQ